MINVSVIILNWNRKNDTQECIRSCKNLNKKNLNIEIIVVDNASEDGSISFLKKQKEIAFLKNKKNLGFAEGNNVGIKYALKNKADYVLVLNNDTKLHKDILVQLVKEAQKRKDGGAFSPKIYFAKGYEFHKDRYKKSELGKVFWSAGGEIDWNNVYGKNRGVDEVDFGQYEKVEETDFCTGACVLYRVQALKKVGLFDERYFMYLEDLELSVRMNKKKWKNYYVPKAILWHKVAQSSGIGSNLNDYFITRNRLLFGMTYASIRTRVALVREAVRLFFIGRQWQRVGVMDYFTGNLYKGSWK